MVGENSAGKTSFLAGLRYLFEALASAGSRNPFNRDPYFLGSFQEIAHCRIRGRPTASFVMRMEIEEDDITHEFRYARGEPQPELGVYRFSSKLDTATIDFTEKFISLKFGEKPAFDDITVSADEMKSFVPIEYIRENLLYLGFIFDHLLRFQLRQDGAAERLQRTIPEERLNAFGRRFQGSTAHLQKNVFASAPVRTQPHRTYTPSEVPISSEGDQVPLELARAKLRSPERWNEIQKSLASFGRDSGLFTNIDIRQFGRSDIDPFQVLVRIGGARRNIVDVRIRSQSGIADCVSNSES